MADTVSIFISYARKDEAFMQVLESHLAPLKRRKLISSWHDGCISPGEDWEAQIKANLQQADIILLLISVDFINSDYCYDVELTKAIERHQAGEARVVPVILRDCDWQELPVSNIYLRELQALPKDARPINNWNNPDQAFADTARGIRRTIQELHLKRYEQVFTAAVQAAYPLSPQAVASLQTVQQQLGLKAEDIARVEQPIQEAAETRYQKALRAQEKAERQREAAECQRKQTEYYNGGLYHLENGNYPQAIAYFEQAEQYGHADASRMLAEAKRQQHDREDAEHKHPGQQDTAKRLQQEELSSERFGANYYAKLRDLLAAQDWQAADEETYNHMLEVMDRQTEGWLDIEHIEKFPGLDLRNIDRLWVNYSKGKFGFSVQKEIWQRCGSPTSYNKEWEKFGEVVGWRTKGGFLKSKEWLLYSQLTFSTEAPKGHLPRWDEHGWCVFYSLASRLAKCKP